MALRDPANYMGGRNHAVDADRHLIAGLLGSPASVTPAAGVTPTNMGGGHGACGDADLKVSPGGGTRQVSVAAGHAFVRGATAAAQGVYAVWNDAATTVTLDAADANPRYDLVCARIRDNDPGIGNAVSVVDFTVIKGDPSPTPADKAIPTDGSYLVLARVRVPGGSFTTVLPSSIDDLRAQAVALGGIRRFRGTLPSANLTPGEFAINSDDGSVHRWTGTGWVRPFPTVNPGLDTWPTPTYAGQQAYNPRPTLGSLPMFFDGGAWRSLGRGSLQWAQGGALEGSAPLDDTSRVPLLMQGGTAVGTSSGSGDLLINFPQAFPRGIASIVCQIGNRDLANPTYNVADGVGISVTTMPIGGINLVPWDYSLSSFKARVFGAGGLNPLTGVPVNSVRLGGCGSIRVNWLAYGW